MSGKLSIGAAWTEAAAFVRRERRVLAPVVLGLIMVPAVVATMVQPPAPAGETAEPGAWMIVVLLMVAAMIAGQMVIVLLANGWHDSVGKAIRRSLGRLPVLILAGLVVMVPVFIAFALVAGGMMTSSGGMPKLQSNLGPGASVAVLLLILVLVFVMIRLLPLIAVVANGSNGPIASLKQTFGLTRGNFWKLLGFALLLTIAFAVLGMAVGAVFGSVVTLALGAPQPWSVSLLLIALVAGLLQAAFVTIYSSMLARITVQLEGGATNGT